MTRSPLQPLQPRPRWTQSWWPLGALLLSGCQSLPLIQTRVLPIPVDATLRAACAVPTPPADPVMPSAALQFSLAQAEFGACEYARAEGLLGLIDAHNGARR